MANYDTSIRVNTKVDASGLKKIESGLNQLVGNANKLANTLASGLGIGLGVAGLMKLGKEAIDLASDIQEVQNVVDTAFKDMSYKMEAFADTCIEKFGLSKLSAKQMGSTFMAMAANMVPSMEQASDMAIELTARSADMASFYNKTAEEAATALKAVFTGETEVLKQYGVIMSEINLQQYAYQSGLNKTLKEMTQAEKVQLRYNYVMEQTSLAAGDFEKTSDSWANQTRILSEQFKELLSVLGSGLIMVLTPAIRGLNQLLSYLISIANALGTIMSQLFGISSVEITAGGADAAEAYGTASESVDDYTDSVKQADKANKKSLSSFDSLEVINKSSSTTGSAGVGTSAPLFSGVTPITTKTGAEENTASNLEKTIDALIDKAEALAGLFQKGFDIGSGNALEGLKDIYNSLNGIAKSMMELIMDADIQGAVSGWFDRIITAAGQITGSLVSIGVSATQNLLGGMERYLDENASRIKDYIISILDISGNIAEMTADYSSAIANIFSAFGEENGQILTANLIGIITNASMGIIELTAKLAEDMTNVLTKPFIDNQGEFKTAVEGFLSVSASACASFKEYVDHAFATLDEVYDKNFAPFFDSVADGVSRLTQAFLIFWNENVQPLLDRWAVRFDELVNNSLQPMADYAILTLGEIADMLMVFWENVLIPLIDWINNNILPVLLPILDGLVEKFFVTKEMLAEIIMGIIDRISGITQFLTGVFTGDWQKAWDGIVKIFSGIQRSIKGIVNGIIGILEALAHSVVQAVNVVIRAINSLSFDIPDWVPEYGGKSIGFNIPELTTVSLPRLANGAVIRGGNPFAAILGDQPLGQTNVETPVSTIEDAVTKGMERYSGNRSMTINLNYDGETFARLSLPDILAEMDREGYDVDVLGGTV